MSKYTVLSVSNREGISSKTNNPYKIPRAVVLTPFRQSSTQNWTLSGAGLVTVELTVADSFYQKFESKFKADFKGSPITYDFEVGMDSEGKNVLIEFEQTSSKPADYSAAKMGA